MDEDIFLWPDGDWCYVSDIEEYGWKSDDYERVGHGTPRWHELTEIPASPDT